MLNVGVARETKENRLGKLQFLWGKERKRRKSHGSPIFRGRRLDVVPGSPEEQPRLGGPDRRGQDHPGRQGHQEEGRDKHGRKQQGKKVYSFL